jgi:hypothetical protein
VRAETDGLVLCVECADWTRPTPPRTKLVTIHAYPWHVTAAALRDVLDRRLSLLHSKPVAEHERLGFVLSLHAHRARHFVELPVLDVYAPVVDPPLRPPTPVPSRQPQRL